MDILVLEGKNIESKEKMHEILKKELEFPDYYGENLDALWDCLSGWVDLPLKIIWNDYDESRNKMGDYAERFLDVFQLAQDELDGFEIEIN